MLNSKARNIKSNNFKDLLQAWEVTTLLCILLLVSGCSFFDTNHKKSAAELDSEPLTLAPQSTFSISTQSGKAPLTVSFTDNSTNGSATITTWAWDFGDGGSSAEQNPEYIYQTAGSYNVSLTVTSLDGSDSASMAPAVTVAPADIVAKLNIVDEKGIALSGVTTTSETFDIQSQEANEYTQLLVKTRPSEVQGVLRLKKEGYLDGLVFLNGNQIDSTQSVTMLNRLPAIVFDGLQGGELIGKDGASVTIPDSALVKPDGSIVTGEVELYITPVDIRDDILALAFPGSYYGIPTEGEVPVGQDAQQQLISYGVVEYTFFQNGEELQLKQGATASLEMPIYADQNLYGNDIQLGELIPLWILDETTGIWMQENVGVVVENPLTDSGFSLSAQTTHFSWFNTDAWAGFANGGASGGSGGGQGWCNLNVNYVGFEPEEPISLSFYLPVLSSTITKVIKDDSESTQSNILRGFPLIVTAEQLGKSVTQRANCNNEDNTSTVYLTLTLQPKVPEFIKWTPTVIPIFDRTSNTALYEIISNNIKVGGFFTGDEIVDVESVLFSAEVVGIPNRQYVEFSFHEIDMSPTQLTATLSNDLGTVTEVTSHDFIYEHSPIKNFFQANISSDGSTIIYKWSVEGADTGEVYYLGEDPTNLGAAVFNIDDVEAGTISNNQLVGQMGFLKIVFINQYGTTTIVARLSDLECLPGSDLCTPTQ